MTADDQEKLKNDLINARERSQVKAKENAARPKPKKPYGRVVSARSFDRLCLHGYDNDSARPALRLTNLQRAHSATSLNSGLGKETFHAPESIEAICRSIDETMKGENGRRWR
jgi:hypothetical protein